MTITDESKKIMKKKKQKKTLTACLQAAQRLTKPPLQQRSLSLPPTAKLTITILYDNHRRIEEDHEEKKTKKKTLTACLQAAQRLTKPPLPQRSLNLPPAAKLTITIIYDNHRRIEEDHEEKKTNTHRLSTSCAALRRAG